ncbi:MAG TPA: hypothetical protein VF949_02685 [Reyranella sp.]|jgi:hypothetical protein
MKEYDVPDPKPKVIVGVLLIAIGIAGLLIDNITFHDTRTVIDAAPMKVTEERAQPLPIPSIAGVIAIVAGGALLWFSRQERT